MEVSNMARIYKAVGPSDNKAESGPAETKTVSHEQKPKTTTKKRTGNTPKK